MSEQAKKAERATRTTIRPVAKNSTMLFAGQPDILAAPSISHSHQFQGSLVDFGCWSSRGGSFFNTTTTTTTTTICVSVVFVVQRARCRLLLEELKLKLKLEQVARRSTMHWELVYGLYLNLNLNRHQNQELSFAHITQRNVTKTKQGRDKHQLQLYLSSPKLNSIWSACFRVTPIMSQSNQIWCNKRVKLSQIKRRLASCCL